MTVDYEEPDSVENESGGNRLFIILAVGLAGLIVLGLLAIGGVLVLRNIQGEQRVAQEVVPVAATPTLAIVAELPTKMPTNTPIPTVAPVEPTITPTNTPVVMPTNTPSEDEVAAAAETAEAEATDTPVPVGTPVSSDEVPNTGFGGFELALMALGLVAVLFVSRRARQTA